MSHWHPSLPICVAIRPRCVEFGKEGLKVKVDSPAIVSCPALSAHSIDQSVTVNMEHWIDKEKCFIRFAMAVTI